MPAPAGELEPLPTPQPLAVLGQSLADEFKLLHGEQCKYLAQKHGDLWICSCGEVMSNGKDTCSACQCKLDEILADGDKNCIEQKQNERLTAGKQSIYAEASQLMTSESISGLEKAQKLFASIPDYKDANEKCQEASQKIEQLKEKSKKNKKIALIVTAILTVIIAFLIILFNVIIPFANYSKAVKLMESGKYDEAIETFESLDNYKDSVEKIPECQYLKATSFMESEKYDEAIEIFTSLGDYKDSREQLGNYCYPKAQELMNAGNNLEAKAYLMKCYDYKDSFELYNDLSKGTISARGYHTVGLKSDGTALAVGWNEYGQCDVDEWTDIVAISAGSHHTVGLKSDGTVVAVGDNDDGECDVDEWTDIKLPWE